MAGRREELLDAAITVLGERGIHALTHRAVDTAAGLPAGSTSNHFRTRDALLDAVVERFAARDRAIEVRRADFRNPRGRTSGTPWSITPGPPWPGGVASFRLPFVFVEG